MIVKDSHAVSKMNVMRSIVGCFLILLVSATPSQCYKGSYCMHNLLIRTKATDDFAIEGIYSNPQPYSCNPVSNEALWGKAE